MRALLREVLQARKLGHLDETAVLLVSELVGNAIRHARGTTPGLELRLSTDGKLLRIEVLDTDPRAPTVRDDSELGEGGYGLVLVQALADDWGVRQLKIGKSVWIGLRALPLPGLSMGGTTATPTANPQRHARIPARRIAMAPAGRMARQLASRGRGRLGRDPGWAHVFTPVLDGARAILGERLLRALTHKLTALAVGEGNPEMVRCLHAGAAVRALRCGRCGRTRPP